MAEKRLHEIRDSRLKKRQALIDAGKDPYPAEARRTHTTAEVLNNFEQLEADTHPILMTGRITALRQHGGVTFLDFSDAYGQMQLQVTLDDVGEEQYKEISNIDIGDFLQVAGKAITTQRGVKTLSLEQWNWLSKSIRPLPDKWHGLKDPEKRYRRRELDLLLNDEARAPIVIKSETIDWVRKHLKEQGFLEVETPILQPQAGGAAAQPFLTHHNSLDTDLYLRIAPELYLKRLLVGGLEKVFELGRNFRNEGMDREHNPEFTMCEFYWAYADYEDLMEFSETMISELVKSITGKSKITYRDQEIDFSPGWEKVSYINVMKEQFDIDILEQKDVSSYLPIFTQHGLEIPKVQTYSKLVDELYKEVIRPKLVQPTLLYDYPVELKPLAKTKAQDRRVAEVLQVIVGGTELVNAYTELNDPVEQRARFESQQEDRAKGDVEAAKIDEDYLESMEYGMPPAAGWGMGIDRITSILADTPSIRDTITFPLLKPEDKSKKL
jgi:lysyl-tRNA synthetase, class II